jgi:hypothetical protein
VSDDDFKALTIKLTEREVKCLLDTLRFAHMAANILANEEMKKGSVEGAKKMKVISADSNILFNFFLAHYDMGEPLTNIEH